MTVSGQLQAVGTLPSVNGQLQAVATLPSVSPKPVSTFRYGETALASSGSRIPDCAARTKNTNVLRALSNPYGNHVCRNRVVSIVDTIKIVIVRLFFPVYRMYSPQVFSVVFCVVRAVHIRLVFSKWRPFEVTDSATGSCFCELRVYYGE
jgi:hypothetical protein